MAAKPARRAVLLSVGSNVEPARYVPRALALLDRRFGRQHVRVSPAYRAEAVGTDRAQPEFVNLAVLLHTALPPRALREVCRRIEEACGRRRTADRFAPRTMDLDVVLVEGFCGRIGAWRLPDPELERHAYLLVPAADVWPAGRHPERDATLAELRDRLPAAERRRVRALR